jgi:hypothetical protein
MKKQRTIYFNDARHYYLFVFEPPMRLEDAWVPVDEVAGTTVDTFCYGVERGDGLFYPSKVGMRFGVDMQPFEHVAYWRTWHNMQSLIDRGLDPLRVLIDRSHEKGMEFIASLRMPHYGGMDSAHSAANGGGGLAEPVVQQHQFAVLEELVQDYSVDGIELDMAFPGGSRLMPPESAESALPQITEYIGRIAALVRGACGAGTFGVRVLPTEAMNKAQGMDVLTWIQEGLVDFIVPMRYAYMDLDADMPIGWMIEAARDTEIAVYGVLQPYTCSKETGAADRIHPSVAQLRAAAATLYERGVDGLYAWFMRWPLEDEERRFLAEMGDAGRMKLQDKHYVVARNDKDGGEEHYEAALPLEIEASDIGTRHPVCFNLADDFAGETDRIQEVLLRLRIANLVGADCVDILLNGESLAGQVWSRDYGDVHVPYESQWLECRLVTVRPKLGENLLEIVLEERVADLAVPLRLEEVEVKVRYGAYAPRLK